MKKRLILFILILLLMPFVNSRQYEEPINITGFQELLQWNNRVTDYKAGIGILLIVFVVSFVSLKVFESEKALAGALFFTMIISIGLRFLDVLNSTIMIATIIICGFMAILLMWVD